MASNQSEYISSADLACGRRWETMVLSLVVPIFVVPVLLLLCGSLDRLRRHRKRIDRTSTWTEVRWMAADLVSMQNFVGKVFLTFSILISIGNFLIYLNFVSSYIGTPETFMVEFCANLRTNSMQKIDLIFNSFHMVYFLLRFVAAFDKLLFWWELESLVDLFTLPPAIIEALQDRIWIGFRFLRITRLLSLSDMLLFMGLVDQGRNKKFIKLCSTFAAVWLSGAGFIHLVENTGDWFKDYSNAHEITFLESCYFCIVTMSTVGYGDIYCETTVGRIFMIFFIFGSLMMFASFVPEIAEILQNRDKYKRKYIKPAGVRHVVFVGNICAESARELLVDFLHSERENGQIGCVFLDNKPPDDKFLELMKCYVRHVTYVQGNPETDRGLDRAKVAEADACILIANSGNTDTEAEDMSNIMKIISMKNKNPNITVIAQVMRYQSKSFLIHLPYWKRDRDQVVCLAEIKLGCAGLNALAPGFSTMICNLFMLRSQKDVVKLSSIQYSEWRNLYIDGTHKGVFGHQFSQDFHNLNFQQATIICYRKLGLILIGLMEANTDVLLNPPENCLITPYTKGFVISNSDKEARYISKLCLECHASINMNNTFLIKAISCKCKKIAFKKNNDGMNNNTKSSRPSTKWKNAVKCLLSGHNFPVTNMNANLHKNDNIGQVNAINYDSTGLFHWQMPVSFEEAQLDVHQKLTGQVILCVFAKLDDPKLNLVNFVMPLRMSNIPSNQLKPIVLLGDSNFLQQEWPMLCRFPQVFIKPGSPMNRADLKEANVFECDMCVVLAGRKCDVGDDDQQLVDKQAVICTLNIKTMFREKGLGDVINKIPVTTELAKDSSTLYVLLENKFELSSTPIHLTKSFASGLIINASVFNTITCTMYYDRYALKLLQVLIGGGASEELEEILSEERGLKPGKPDSQLAHSRSRLQIIGLDKDPFLQYNTSCFGDVFLGLLQRHGIICLGLSRIIDDTNLRVVVTAPDPGTRMLLSDKIYCLSSKEFD